MGIGSTFGEAFAKSQLGASIELPIKGQVFISIKNDDKQKIIPIAQKLFNLGFKICATSGTAKILNDHKIKTNYIKKVIGDELENSNKGIYESALIWGSLDIYLSDKKFSK